MTLIANNTELKAVLPGIDINANFATTYQPYLEAAEEFYLQPVLGTEIITELSEVSEPSTQQTAAIKKIQQALANYMLFEMADLSNVKVGGSGFQENTPEGQMQTRQWVHNQTKQKALARADRFLDNALAYMEQNKASFTTWTDTDSYTEFKDLFVSTADDFHKYVPIDHSRRTFLKLKPYLESVQNAHIKPAIGTNLFNKLKTDFTAGALADPYDKLLPMIQQAMCHLAMAEGAVSLPLNFEASGVQIISKADGINTSNPAGTRATGPANAQYQQFITLQNSKGSGALATLKAFLIENTADYSEFTETEAENKNPSLTFHDNQYKKSFMV